MTVVGISGHQEIPAAALAFVEKGIARVLRPLRDDFTGVSSLAAGADQLFAEFVQRMGGRLHAVIPCRRYEESFKDDRDLSCFHRLLNSADAVDTLDHPGPSDEAFLDAGRRIVELSRILVAVWDGRPARGKGGTGDVVRYARERGTKVVVLWPSGVRRRPGLGSQLK